MTGKLTPDELARYHRHIILPEVRVGGQERLKEASILLVGAGGLGSPAALYLAAAGIGRMGIVDFDKVDASNLQRQILHGTDDVGRPKTESAAQAVQRVNPGVKVDQHRAGLSRENALAIIADYDLVVDGTDNFATRYLVNDACVLLKKPNFYGSILRFEGQASVFCVPGGPCYRCLFPEPPPPGMVPSCAEAGVFGVLPGLIGVVQATEAVKHILGLGQSLVGRLLLYDALAMSFSEVRIQRDPACPACGDMPTIQALQDYEALCGPACPVGVRQIDAASLANRLASGECLQLLDVRDPEELEEGSIPGFVMIPLKELAARMGELDSSRPTVVYCRSGGRSSDACKKLLASGFSDVTNLSGGIMVWNEVSPV